MFRFLRDRRRKVLRETPLSEDHRAILRDNVAYARALDAESLEELEGLVQVFLAEKNFEGCGGLVLTDEMRVTIAAQACVLLLGRDTDLYPDLETILVYPTAYRDPRHHDRDGDLVTEGSGVRLGESWTRGVIVLAWDHAKRGAAKRGDGKNVILHEFAHQLDGEDGAMDGAPVLDDGASYKTWAKVLGREFDALVARLHEGRRTDIDGYGATNPAEFFAVVTEHFYERPGELRAKHPELYEEFVNFYGTNPAEIGAKN